MKKFLHAVSEFVLCLLALVAGGILVYVHGYNFELRDALCEFVHQNPYVASGIGGILILLVIGFLYTLGCPKRGPSFVSFDTADGTVSISRNAISDFVRKLGDEFAAVVSLDPVVTANRRHQLSLVLNMTVRAGTRVPELSKLLQERVKESLRDDLGFVDVKKVSVKVQKIIGNPVAHTNGDYEV
ncbi:alkaline shock response membrane anchor protein AmaP [Verrucomicrobiota bacterium]